MMGLKSIKCCQGHTFIAKMFPRGVVDSYTFCPKVRVNPIFVGFYNTVFEGVKSLSWPQKSPCWPANLIGNSQSISYILPNNHRWRNVTENVQRMRVRVWTQSRMGEG